MHVTGQGRRARRSILPLAYRRFLIANVCVSTYGRNDLDASWLRRLRRLGIADL